MRSPWWTGLDLRVLNHVRGVLRRRGLQLTLVERLPTEPCAFAPLFAETPEGGGLAVLAPELSAPELHLVQIMLAEAASDVATVVRARDEGAADEKSKKPGYHGIYGAAPAMQELFGVLERVARSSSTVLVQGEAGTGKELVARAVHQASDRRERRFVVTNCSAFNDNLLDSELFGHKRGAFTGAVVDKLGLFEVADGGTFFLDEIGDMSPTLQVKVLRVLQEGTFHRVGDTEMRQVDVRIVAATNRDLAAMVAEGKFREDLFYRIHVINVVLPPLRERREDIPLLTEQFLARHRRTRPKHLTPACAAQLLAYPWPGNVRELENEIERLVVLAGDVPVIGLDLLSSRIRQWAPAAGEPTTPIDAGSLPAAIEALERKMIGEAMKRYAGNKTRAAEHLRVSRRNLIRLVQKYQLG